MTNNNSGGGGSSSSSARCGSSGSCCSGSGSLPFAASHTTTQTFLEIYFQSYFALQPRVVQMSEFHFLS